MTLQIVIAIEALRTLIAFERSFLVVNHQASPPPGRITPDGRGYGLFRREGSVDECSGGDVNRQLEDAGPPT